MKKLILILLCLVFSFSASQAWFGPAMMGGGTPSVGGGDDCSGDLKFSAHFENNDDITVGTPAGCSDGDSTGTKAGAATYDGTIYCDGSYALKTDVSENLNFSISSGDIFNADEGHVIVKAYIDTYVQYAEVLRAYGDGSNYVAIWTEGSASDIVFYFIRYDNGALSYVGANGAFVEDSWVQIELWWKIGVAGMDMKIEVCDYNCSTLAKTNCISQEGDKDLTTLNTAPTILTLGVRGAFASVIYVDDIEVYGTSGY